jgi:hypothetical protein
LGAEVIGQTGPANTCAENNAFVQRVLGGGTPYSPSSYGVITSWSTMNDTTAGRTSRLLVLEPNPGAGATHYIARQKDQVRAIGSGLNTFSSGLRLPIQPSQQLGLYLPDGQPADTGVCAFIPATMGNTINFQAGPGEPPLNTSVDYPGFAANFRLNASAVVEPDADRDVFGDESQDNCLGTAGAVGGCPNTVSVGKTSVKGKTVTVEVAVPGAGTVKGGSATDQALALASAKKKKKKKKPQPPLRQSSQTVTGKTRQTVVLTLNLSKTGRSKLARKGKLGLSIKVTYTPIGGTAGTATASAKLTSKKKKKKR